MTDLQATLDAIDELAVQQCGHCSQPLPEDGQSLDFCNDYCQQAWIANRNEVVELIGYREPTELAVHAFNLDEMTSPEVVPARPDDATWSDGVMTFNLTIDTSGLEAAFEDMRRAIEETRLRVGQWVFTNWNDLMVFGESYSLVHQSGNGAHFTIIDELHHWRPVGILNATGTRVATTQPTPVVEGEPFDPDYEYDWRPVPALHADEPPLPVMPSVERDWQALIDASRPQVAFAPSPLGSSHRTRRTR